MADIKQKTGQAIRQARERKGLSQTELAERMGVTRATVNGYESGRNSPTVTTLERIANALEISLTILLE